MADAGVHARIGISQGRGGEEVRNAREDKDGGGERCEIKVSAGRCMTMRGENERARAGGAGY